MYGCMWIKKIFFSMGDCSPSGGASCPSRTTSAGQKSCRSGSPHPSCPCLCRRSCPLPSVMQLPSLASGRHFRPFSAWPLIFRLAEQTPAESGPRRRRRDEAQAAATPRTCPWLFFLNGGMQVIACTGSPSLGWLVSRSKIVLILQSFPPA